MADSGTTTTSGAPLNNKDQWLQSALGVDPAHFTGPAAQSSPATHGSATDLDPAGSGEQSQEISGPQVSSAGSGPQAAYFNAAMKPNLDTIDQCLKYTAAYADKSKHAAMAAKRDRLFQAYQAVISKMDPNDETKAAKSIDAVVAAAQVVSAETQALKEATEKSLKAWRETQAAFEKGVTQIQELEARKEQLETNEGVSELRKLADGVQSAVNERRYDDALPIVQQLLVNLKPLYEEYQNQQAAKTAYDAAWKSLQPRLEEALARKSGGEEITKLQREISNARRDMENAAAHKDYVTAKSRLDELPTALEAFDKALGQLRDRYEKTWPALKKQLPTTSQQGSKKQGELERQVSELSQKVESAAAAGDYEAALTQMDAVQAKLAELTAEREAYEKRKKDFETRLNGMKQALDMALGTASDVKEVKAAQDAVKAKKTEAETVATAGDYELGTKRLDELDVAMTAYQNELRKTPHSCDWVNAAAVELSALIDIKYLQASNKIIQAASAYDAALDAHTKVLKKVAAGKQLAADVVIGIFFAGLGGAVGGAAGAAVKSSMSKAFADLAAGGAVIDATKDVAKWMTRTYDKFHGKGGDPTAGLPAIGGNGVELARSLAKAVNAQGIALKMEVVKMARFVKENEAQCKAGDVRVDEDPSAVLQSDPFLKVLGTIVDADQKSFATLLWGQWVNDYGYTIEDGADDSVHLVNNTEGFWAWWYDLTNSIEEQAGKDFGLKARLKAARAKTMAEGGLFEVHGE